MTQTAQVDTTASEAVLECYHCGLPVQDAQEFTLLVDNAEQSFCCPGCQAVASAIIDGGLAQFYRYRSSLNKRAPIVADDYQLYDLDDIQQDFVSKSDDQKVAYLLLDGITCAACVWLIEKHLVAIDGVSQVKVSASTHQCQLYWQPEKIALSEVMHSLANIGYRPQPLSVDNQREKQTTQQRQMLMRLGVAGFGMMQVSMVAIALYAGALQGMDSQWENLFRWLSLLVATPVVLFSAQPFWLAAWRSLKQRYLTMDVSVSLAIILAYLASAWATVMETGEVYFDSVSMFTFFLLLGRYLEMRTRYRNQSQINIDNRLLPLTVYKIDEHNKKVVIPLARLNVGDHVLIESGDTIPCDGVVLEGESQVVEAIITGESEPITRKVGDAVIAGSVNSDGYLVVKAKAVKQQTRISTIESLVNFSQQDKPKIQAFADKVASYFVGATLLISAAVFTFWTWKEPGSALWITLSVLVVTCPCALSLATPTVLAATVARLRKLGLLVIKSHVIETLTHVKEVIFDKTGTLTKGKPEIKEVQVLESRFSVDQVMAIATVLEKGSSHPIAHAFSDAMTVTGSLKVDQLQVITGKGVSGKINEIEYRLGKPTFSYSQSIPLPSTGQWLLLSENDRPIAWFLLEDALRHSAISAVDQLKKQGKPVVILSGDHRVVVESLAHELGDISSVAEASPEEKLQFIRKRQKVASVLMVGDGINDAPVLAGADVSVAMDSASDFARTHADALLMSGNLNSIPESIKTAHRCKRIMQQNIAWALLYNLLALPLAAAGMIPPYLAAIGMSLSSLIVVLNALRINKA